MLIRQASFADKQAVLQLHKTVAEYSGGIARIPAEITNDYINQVFAAVLDKGLMLVGLDEKSDRIIAEIHAIRYGIQIFSHVLTNLTIAVHPKFQGKGLAKKLFSAFLDEVLTNYPDIERIELESRSSNIKSIALYKAVGFTEEGRMKNKTRNKDGSIEDSILMAWYRPVLNKT